MLFYVPTLATQLGGHLDVKYESSQRRHKNTSLGRTFHDKTYLHEQITSVIGRYDVLLITSPWPGNITFSGQCICQDTVFVLGEN